MQKYLLNYSNHIHICQVSPQLSGLERRGVDTPPTQSRPTARVAVASSANSYLGKILALCTRWVKGIFHLDPMDMMPQCLPFYIINEVGHLTTSVDHLAEFCQNYHLAAICTQLMVKFFLQLRFIQYFDCKCMTIPDFSRIDSHFVA